MQTHASGRAGNAGLPLVLAAVLAIAPVAHAKESETAEVCGAARCVAVHDHGDAGNLHSTGGLRPAPRPAPFYVVRFSAGRASASWSYLWVPSAGAQRADNFGRGAISWRSAPFLAPLLADLTKGLEPYPASRGWTREASHAHADFPVLPVALGALGAAIAMGALRRRIRGRRVPSVRSRL